MVFLTISIVDLFIDVCRLEAAQEATREGRKVVPPVLFSIACIFSPP